jgi:hypothetical protein
LKGNRVKISLSDALSRAWNRMISVLFKPFDLHKWLVVGFTAFLAGLADGHRGSGGARGYHNTNFREFPLFPQRALDWLNAHPVWFVAIVFAVVLAVVVGIIFLWLSSRGKFMFLDNVVRNQAEIAKPWHEYRKEGDSLFVWRLVFGFISFAAFSLITVFFFFSASRIYAETRFSPLPILWIVGLSGVFLILGLVVGALSLFLNDFVVPLMYRNRISANHGWKLFLPLLKAHLGSFILYGLIVFAVIIAFVIAVVVAGLVTCCIGWFLLVIPYIGMVVTLPFWYWLRAFGPELLGQFGLEYSLFPPPAPAAQTPRQSPAHSAPTV